MPNFAQQIFDLNHDRSNKTALIDAAQSLTYGQLMLHAYGFASYLVDMGLKPQSRIIFYLDDCVEWPVAFLASLLAGLNPVCVNHNNTKERLDYLIDLTDAAAVVSNDVLDIDSSVANLTKSQILTCVGHEPITAYEFHDDEPCFWLMTSGTTGHPKAIVHRHQNLSDYYQQTKSVYFTNSTSSVFATAKLSFGYGLNMSITVSLPVGATVYLMSGTPSPTRIFEVVNQHRITHFYTVPTIINSILKHNKNQKMPSLTHVLSAGETLPPVLSKEFYNTFGVLARNTIGMSEVNAMYCIQDFDHYEHGTVGMPMPGVECRLVNEQGETVPDGEVGELYIKTYSKATQYWKDWKYTNYTFVGDWIRTGDKMKKTDAGNYVYVSRNDDLAKINGQFVSSIEIEEVLRQSAQVYDCAVVFVPTDKFPEIHAFVMLNNVDSLDTKELQQVMATELPYYKIPSRFHVVESIPKTLTNKTKRTEMRNRLLQSAAAV